MSSHSRTSIRARFNLINEFSFKNQWTSGLDGTCIDVQKINGQAGVRTHDLSSESRVYDPLGYSSSYMIQGNKKNINYKFTELYRMIFTLALHFAFKRKSEFSF